ncbi:MAG TPA: hypothetical protein VEH06_05440 [Candidatus Bathyarchaeia archaeon]|nr:hypothetical protein [Candidatus Bathyarchaeia archaeon]
MGDSDDHSNSQQRGRAALDLEHENISGEDERRMDTRICIMYGVEADEAKDIHTNYHSNRLYSLLRDRARKHGMIESTFLERLKSLNVYHYAQLVSQGRLMEMAAVDVLYKGLYISEYYQDDRYISFYG